MPDGLLDLLQGYGAVGLMLIDDHFQFLRLHIPFQQAVHVAGQVPQGRHLGRRHQEKLVAASDGGLVQLAQASGAVDQNIVIDIGEKPDRLPQRIGRNEIGFAQRVGRQKHIHATGMMGNIAVQQAQVEPRDVAQQLVKVVAVRAHAQQQGHMSEVGMQVQNEHLLGVPPGQKRPQVDRRGRAPRSSSYAEKGQNLARSLAGAKRRGQPAGPQFL